MSWRSVPIARWTGYRLASVDGLASNDYAMTQKTLDQAMQALTAFVNDWIGAAAQRVMYRPENNSYARLHAAIIKAAEDRDVSDRLGWAVFSKTFTLDRERPSGYEYVQASACFEDLELAENALAYCQDRREGDHILCEIWEHRK